MLRGIIARAILQQAKEYAIEALVTEGIFEALGEMEAMIGNAGQQAIYDTYIIEVFPVTAEGKLILDRGDFLKVEDIEIPHRDAVYIILQAGCDIVNYYYALAQELDTIIDFIS